VPPTVASVLRRQPRELLSIAAEALGRYKLRTALSILGVVLGVAAVIAMMSVGEGAREEALQQVTNLGLDNLVARSRTAGPLGDRTEALTLGDAERVLGMVPFAAAASPLVERYERLTREGTSVMTSVIGVRPSYQRILKLTLDRGRFLSALDERSAARVCVLGSDISRRLFRSDPPVGDVIRVRGQYCRVIGVLSAQSANPRVVGALAWRDLNQSVILPIAAVTRRSTEGAPGQPVDEIWVQTTEGERAVEIGQVLTHTLTRLHGGRAGFEVVVPRELLAQRYRTQRTFSVVLGSVAGIALVVGGIGIMNIMLASVTERTQEIGVRRAVGATRRDVTAQFLTESLLMTLGGGSLGIAVGVLVSSGITTYAGWSTRVSPEAVLLGFGVSATVGLVFGLYPAFKAARLEPVVALHHE
jgi:putative ABC transport system permease protein